MIAIHTKYIGPTASKGARIKAYTSSGYTATISCPHELSHEIRHFAAVIALVKKHNLSWNLEKMRYGDSADGQGYVFCFDHSIVNAQL